jgi:SOS-response transcriptional repressor LexA
MAKQHQETWNARLAQAVKDRAMTRTAFAKAIGVSGPTVTDWLNGNTAELKAEHASRICAVLALELDWLLNGADDRSSPSSLVKIKLRSVPVLNYQHAGNLKSVPLNELRNQVEHAPIAVRHSDQAFALRVQGDAMVLPTGVRGRTFPHGMMIFVDPEQVAKSDDYVLAHLGTGAVVFRQLQEEEGAKVLVALNPDRDAYPVVREDYAIVGKVIDASYGGL